MSFDRRLLLAASTVTTVTLGGVLGGVWVAFNLAQERSLDAALREVAAADVRALDAVAPGATLPDQPGPVANDVGPLPKLTVVYAEDGAELAATTNFHGPRPTFAMLPKGGSPFDLWDRDVHLRGVRVVTPGRRVVLMAATRTDIDGDARFLGQAMATAFAAAAVLSILASAWAIQRLTRGHRAIADAARRVAGGDLSARVGADADESTARLARDVDEMIERLALLVTSQQRFIAHAAHELRSPLTALYGELQHALSRPRDAAQYHEAIEEALDATRRLRTLANDLLALARVGTTEREAPLEDVPVAELFRVVQEETRDEATRRDVGVHADAVAPDVTVRGRPTDLGRLLRNLVENAVRYAGPGSVRLSCTRQGAEVVIVVADDGPGIRAADRDRIFEPFYRGAPERGSAVEGTGLGLAIAREVATTSGGSLVLEPTPRGARFVVRLPTERRTSEPALLTG